MLLPVSMEAGQILDQALARRPRAVLLLGQDLPALFGTAERELGATHQERFMELSLVRQATKEGGALQDVSCRRAIGSYVCNTVYSHTPRTLGQDIPVAFMHVFYWADKAQLALVLQVLRVFNALENSALSMNET